jgi:uncharacterized membrane protein YphA (DoxX/SURF4 family)
MAQQNSKVLHISLWVVQGLLASMFIMAGGMKSTQPVEQLATSLPWVSQVPVALVRFIGISEVLGGLGLVLPALLRIKTVLTPLAAVGIVVIMLLAAILHISRGETPAVGMNIVIGLLAVFVAWGRSTQARIQAKA